MLFIDISASIIYTFSEINTGAWFKRALFVRLRKNAPLYLGGKFFMAQILVLLPPIIAIGLALITKEVYSSLFIGVLDMTPEALLRRDFETIDIFLISRLPRLLAILCTGMGMSVWPV